MNTISSRKPSKEAATVLHSVLSRCLAVLPADCPFKLGNHIGQFFRKYQLKPLVTNVDGTGRNTQETPLIHKFLVRQEKETADPDYHPDSLTDVESDSDPCSDVVLSPDLAKNEGAKVCTIRPKPSSLLSEEGKSNVERESAWQAMGFAAADQPSACLECWGCWRNKKCYEVAKWERKQTAILKDKSASSLFLARAKASATITSKLAEESLSQESLPSVSSLSSPVEEKEAASQESSSPAKARARFCPSLPLGSPPHPGISSMGSSLPGSSPPGSGPASSSPHNHEVPMRAKLLKDTAATCHKTMLISKQENPKRKHAKVTSPLVEINNNRNSRQPLDFSSAFPNKKVAKQLDEADLPCTCDDCRFCFQEHFHAFLFFQRPR